MAKNTFDMKYQKKKMGRYLAITFIPPYLVMGLAYFLFEIGLLPPIEFLAKLMVYVPMGSIPIVGYFTILKIQHRIDVRNNSLTETNWRDVVVTRIKAEQIASYRRNFLGEIVLLDKIGARLLAVESGMTNLDRFEQWLADHNIESK